MTTAPKRGRGRPPLPPEERRSERLEGVRFSPAEIAAVEALAAERGLTVTEAVRGLVLRWLARGRREID